MRRAPLLLSWITMAVLFVLSLVVPACGAEPSLEKVLPQGFLHDWMAEGKVRLYNQDTLFEHINGEAELYRPYNFEVLATASYASRRSPDVLVVADVYRMGTLLDAFGIYAHYRRANDEGVKIGGEGFISPTQMMFYQDRYFIRLQVTGAASLGREIFLDGARLISRNLPVGSLRPRELDALSIPAVVPRSVRYDAQSLLGYPFFRKGMIADAVLAGQSMRLFVIFEASREAAQKAFDAYRSYLKKGGQSVQTSGTPERTILTAVDALYGGVLVEWSGSLLVGAVKVKDQEAARQLLGQLRERVALGQGR